MSSSFVMTPLSDLLQPTIRPEFVEADKIYNILGAHWYAEGLYTKDTKPGSSIQADKLYRVEEGDFVYNRLFAWKGSFAIASNSNHNCYVSNEFSEEKSYTWNKKQLGDYIIDDCYGTSEKTMDDPNGIPILRMGNIQNGRINTTDLKYLYLDEREKDKQFLKKGDIVVNRTN